MKNTRSKLLAGLPGVSMPVLFLAVLVIAAAAGFAFIHQGGSEHAVIAFLAGLAALAGTATVTYQYPVAGATAPTAQQVRRLSMVIAEVHFGDTDTSAVITHNFGESATEATDEFPIVLPVLFAPGTVEAILSVALTDTNTVTLTKNSATGTNGTWEVYILRPTTLMR